MHVLYFAQARQVTGLPAENLDFPGPVNADQLWTAILRRHPDLVVLHPVIRLARNGEFSQPDTVFLPDDEVALIPPVSGG